MVQLSHLYIATEKVIALTICFTQDSVAVSMLIFQFIPPSKSILHICFSVPSLEIGPSVPFV